MSKQINKVIGGQDEFMVIFDDRLCSPTWNSKGAAQAYLSALEKGARQPEYATIRQ